MENATKALLIAGSILIAILLIAMGMRVFTSTQGTTDAVEGTMQTTEVAMFNNKFMQYVGYDKTVNDAKALLNLIIANNSTNSRKVNARLILKNGKGVNSTNNINTLNTMINRVSELSSSSEITILITKGWVGGGWTSGNDSNGYITDIYIADNLNY